MTPSGSGQDEMMQQFQARERYANIIRLAKVSGDSSAYARVQSHRDELMEATAALHATVAKQSRPLMHTAALIRSRHPDRAQANVNPARIATAAQPAIEQGLITREQVQLLVSVAKSGVRLAEFRQLEGPVLDLSQGNTECSLDHEVLLQFYFEQAFLGRVLMFPPDLADTLDASGELVLSPSFLVRVLGKKPRCILNLSSTKCGVNQRLHELMPDLVADPDGYATVADMALMLVEAFVAMVTRPGDFDIEDILGISLGMTVMDGDAAFFRWPVAADAVGVEATRVARVTVVALCCVFGAEMSALNFSFVTAAIKALHKSNLDAAGFLSRALVNEEELHPILRKLHADELPAHSHLSKGHVDDFAALEILSGLRPRASAMDLAWAIQVFLGMDGLSLKKWRASTFWTDLQKVIGAWFDVGTFSVAMPKDKLEAALSMLESEAFSSEKRVFPIDLCQSLEGKLRWATLATPLGSTGALIGICKQRQLNESGDRSVPPARYQRESPTLALAKFHNELLIRKLFLRAAVADPSLASCSMLSMLKIEDRLHIPGESKWLAWLSGDFSMHGQSFGVELLHPEMGYVRRYCFLPHPPAVVAALRVALAGNSEKRGYAIVSAVCERQNKLMAEQQWRAWLAGRPCIVLEDNTGSVACFNSGYSSNVIMQTMQLASNLRQALDEARAMAFYCTSKNMSFHDEVSRDPGLAGAYVKFANEQLRAHGMAPWIQEEPCLEARAISEWLPDALECALPMLQQLLEGLETGARVPRMRSQGLDPAVIAQPAEMSWQLRVRAAAKDMPCKLGSFGPNAHDISHLEDGRAEGVSPSVSFNQLSQLSRVPAEGAYGVLDLRWGGGSASMAALTLGARVVGTVGLSNAAARLARRLTAAPCFATLEAVKASGSLLSAQVVLAGLRHEGVFSFAAEAGASLVILEGADDVFSAEGAGALVALVADAADSGFGQVAHQRVVHALHGSPGSARRRVLVAFKDEVRLTESFQFPAEASERTCVGDFMEPSTGVPARCWDSRPWVRFPARWKANDSKVFGLGYVGSEAAMTYPEAHRKVLHPCGLFPTDRAASGPGVVCAIRLRAMCPLYSAWRMWAAQLAAAPRQAAEAGGVAKRALTAAECFALVGFPSDFGGGLNEEEALELAADAVPLQYFTTLLGAGLTQLKLASVGVEEGTVVKSDRAAARLARRLASSGVGVGVHVSVMRANGASNPRERHRVGYSIYLDLNREQLAPVPISADEVLAMSMLQASLRYKHIEASKAQVEMSVRHWRSFCRRFNRPVHLRCGSLELDRAAAAQAELFILYELASFDIKASTVVEKLWGVGKEHEARRMQNPFKDNAIVKAVAREVCSLDGPPQPKIPVTDSTLGKVRERLDFSRRESLVLWTGIRVAIAFLCRISEWGFGGKHALKWFAVSFFDKDRNVLSVDSPLDLPKIFELELVFFSDKTHNFGEGTCRSFFAIPDQSDTRCIVRDLARVWLLSERNLEHHVFSWANDTQGPTRTQVAALLKAAAVADGIPGADISTHSLRVAGLSRLLAAGMSYESARTFGRWKSDCARRYWWPATSLAQAFSMSIWDNPTYARVRGGGAVQYL